MALAQLPIAGMRPDLGRYQEPVQSPRRIVNGWFKDNQVLPFVTPQIITALRQVTVNGTSATFPDELLPNAVWSSLGTGRLELAENPSSGTITAATPQIHPASAWVRSIVVSRRDNAVLNFFMQGSRVYAVLSIHETSPGLVDRWSSAIDILNDTGTNQNASLNNWYTGDMAAFGDRVFFSTGGALRYIQQTEDSSLANLVTIGNSTGSFVSGNWFLRQLRVTGDTGNDPASETADIVNWTDIIAKVGDVLAVKTNVPSEYSNSVSWSGINNPLEFDPVVDLTAGNIAFPDRIDAIASISKDMVVFTRSGIQYGRFTGNSASLFSFRTIETSPIIGKKAHVTYERTLYWMAIDGFYSMGENGVIQPIGDGHLDRRILDILSPVQSLVDSVSCLVDTYRGLVIWNTPLVAAANLRLSIIYNIRNGTWTMRETDFAVPLVSGSQANAAGRNSWIAKSDWGIYTERASDIVSIGGERFELLPRVQQCRINWPVTRLDPKDRTRVVALHMNVLGDERFTHDNFDGRKIVRLDIAQGNTLQNILTDQVFSDELNQEVVTLNPQARFTEIAVSAENFREINPPLLEYERSSSGRVR